MNQFDRLEKLAQQLIEEPFQRFFPTRLRPADLAEHLLAAVEKNHQRNNGAAVYQIMVNPVDYAGLAAVSGREALEIELSTLTDPAANLTGQVVLVKNDTVGPGQVIIKANNV